MPNRIALCIFREARMLDLLIENALIIQPEGRFISSIAIEEGRIVALAPGLSLPSRKQLDLKGRPIIPGLVDTHVHFRDPGHPHKEDWATGSAAAVAGGVTTVCDMPNTSPPTVDRRSWKEKNALAQARSVADYGIWVGATHGNCEVMQELLDEKLACGIKVFMGATTGSLLVDDATLEEVFTRTQGRIGVHAEDEQLLAQARLQFQHNPAPAHHQVRPPQAALAAVKRLVGLMQQYPRPVQICHISSAMELAFLEDFSELPFQLEVCPHHLFLIANPAAGNWTKCNPPIRTQEDQDALWKALQSGRLHSIGSDHAPHSREEKEKPYWEAPSGVPGVETSLRLLLKGVLEGRLSLEQLTALGAENPARQAGLVGKGRIAVGNDADLVVLPELVLAPLQEEELLSRVGWSPFTGTLVAPPPVAVFRRGVQVASKGKVLVEGGGLRVALHREEPA
jgi:dihydroorotase